MSNPEISVVIPTLGRTEELAHCLHALVGQTFKQFEVIIVTDKKERLAHLIAKYPTLAVS